MDSKRTSARAWLLGLAFALPLPAHALLPIEHWVSASGANVYFVETHALPILDVEVVFGAGSSYDPAGKYGLANITAHMFSAGADGYDEEQIAKRLADVGAELGAVLDPDRGGLSLRTLASEPEKTQALSLLAAMLEHPTFPDAVLAREKARVIAGLKESETKPEYIAARAFGEMLYPDHPYGKHETVESVDALHRADLQQFYRDRYVSSNAVVAVIGDVGRSEAEAIADKLTASLPRSGAPDLSAPPAQAGPAQIRRISHPASQAHIHMGVPGISRGDPDYFPLIVGNYVLGGGGFESRLLHQVRDQRGLAYSVFSYFTPLRLQGPFQIGLQTKKEQSEEALKIARDVVTEFLANGPTEKELQAAKQNIIGGFPLRIDSNRKILGYLGIIGFYQLPLTYLDDFVNNVGRVSVADVKAAFARHVRMENMVTVIVGAGDQK